MLVDDFSRLFVHGAWMTEQNTRAGQQVLRAAIQRRGQPEIIYSVSRECPPPRDCSHIRQARCLKPRGTTARLM